MRLLRRNTTRFEYYKNLGEQEVLDGTLHTGQWAVQYSGPVRYRGHISVPSGLVSDNLFGVGTPYTHILLMDNTKADITEDGIISWRGNEYEITAVRPSINVLAVALKRCTKSHLVNVIEPEQNEPVVE